MSPALPAWATYIIFCTTYFISAFLHLSMSHILIENSFFFFFFWWGLSCFCRMFSPISGLYLIQTPWSPTWNRMPPQQMFLKLQRYYQYIRRYYFSFMPLNPLAWALPSMTLYAKPSPQHLVTNSLVQRLELLNRATDLTTRGGPKNIFWKDDMDPWAATDLHPVLFFSSRDRVLPPQPSGIAWEHF